MKTLFATILAIMTITSCTENIRARQYGGTEKMDLPANRKLVNITWKDADMWLLTRPMRKEEVAETFEFQEKSSNGILEGTIVVQEHKN